MTSRHHDTHGGGSQDAARGAATRGAVVSFPRCSGASLPPERGGRFGGVPVTGAATFYDPPRPARELRTDDPQRGVVEWFKSLFRSAVTGGRGVPAPAGPKAVTHLLINGEWHSFAPVYASNVDREHSDGSEKFSEYGGT